MTPESTTSAKKKSVFNDKTGHHEIDGIGFSGHFLEWKLEYVPETYLKESELSGDEWRKGGYVRIYLNGDCVLEEFCREPERALMLLSKGLHELQCFFEGYGVQIGDWQKDLVNKKVRHGSIPSTVIRYVGNGEVIIKRDDGKDFLPDLYPSLMEDDGTYETEWKDEDRVHITDKRINWNVPLSLKS
jgi:hypothetical protein